VRCVAIVNPVERTVEFFSRQGKLFTTLERLKSPLLTLLKNYKDITVFDGELCIIDENGNENFSAAVQKVTKKDVIAEDIKYCIFDIMPLEVFNNDGGKIFSERYNEYISLYNANRDDDAVFKHIMPLLQERLTTQDQFDKWTNWVKDNGWEGFMLRKDAPYKSGRIKDLIKVKKFQDAEYIVEGIETGKASYNECGMKEYDIVSAIVISHKGNKVNVGSGLSKEQRITWYNDPTQIIGKTVTVQYFEESTNKNDSSISLRFPVLKFVYEADRDI
jgi:DNA ligase-1